MESPQLGSPIICSDLRVNYIRDGLVEEFHEGFVSFGNDSNLSPYFLRSCAKPLQASLLLDYKIDFTQEELAFCSGSHAGESCHIELANQILKKLGLNESNLKCGIHTPLSHSMQDKMLLMGEHPTQLHNNCSGKHLGFLAICLKNNWDIETYYEPNHPLQIEVKKRIYDLCEIQDKYPITTDGCGGKFNPAERYPITTDGCGVPIVSMPLNNIVKGYKNLHKKYPKIIESIKNNPYIYGGENRLDTEIIQNTNNLIAKVGAGGLCVVYNVNTKEGFAVKINSASNPARRIAVLEIINNLGWGNIKFDNTIKTINGKVVGNIEVKYKV